MFFSKGFLYQIRSVLINIQVTFRNYFPEDFNFNFHKLHSFGNERGLITILINSTSITLADLKNCYMFFDKISCRIFKLEIN